MKETLKKLRDNLRPIYGERETEAIIRILFHYLKGWSLTDMLVHSDDKLSDFVVSEVNDILKRLLNYEPIQYITGEARFHGLEFKVRPGVLIPRIETEELVDIIIEDYKNKEDLKILDIGTGSGCIAISLARGLKFPIITALDKSETAIEVAEENARLLKVKVRFINADIFKWNPDTTFDVIVSNPPYVTESEKKVMERNVLDYEPAEALFVSDSDPLLYYRRIVAIAITSLNERGSLYLEINPKYADEIKSLLDNASFSSPTVILDSFGRKRFISAHKGS